MKLTKDTWRARFVDGPCRGHRDRWFAVQPVWPEMILMPDPRDGFDDYVLVGGNGLEPGFPWEDQVRYELTTLDLDSEHGELLGLYKVAS